jgi:Restriction endonuclease
MLSGRKPKSNKTDDVDSEMIEKSKQFRCSIEGCQKLTDTSSVCYYHRTTCHVDGCQNPNIDGAFCQGHWLENEEIKKESAANNVKDPVLVYKNWQGNLEGLDSVFSSATPSKKRRSRNQIIETRDMPTFRAINPRKRSSKETTPLKDLNSVTPREAEFLAAAWMKKLGLGANQVTPSTKDGGIDVDSELWAAQVKFQSQPISVSAVRQLMGAKQQGQRAIFFSKSDYTRSSVDFANQRGVALFVLKTGQLEPKSELAETLIRRLY